VYAAEKLAAFSTRLELAEIPTEVVAAAKLHLLDAVGTGLAALGLDQVAAARAVARELGGGEEASALGLPRRIGAANAALANGATMHALDFDDTHEATLIHSSVVVAATVLAVGEACEASGEELLAAAIAGYEVSAGSVSPRRARCTARAFTRPRSAASSPRRPRRPACAASRPSRPRTRSGSPAVRPRG
jgi:2-methylcitrate dehydratase PrpD